MNAKTTTVRTNVTGVIARINQIGEKAVRGISSVMEDEAEIMMLTAIDFAPKDSGSLESAIYMEEYRDTNRRKAFKIYVDVDQEYVSDQNYPSTQGKTVGDYAHLMERFLSPHGISGMYYINPKTLDEKPNAGGRYLERAVKDRKKQLLARAEAKVRRVLS